MTEKIVIKQSSRKQLFLTLIGILLVGASQICISIPLFIIQIVGFIGVIFFGICLSFVIYRLIRPRNILEIDENGFIDFSSAAGVGFIPWKNVKELYISSIFSQKLISVTLYDLENFLETLPFIKQKLILVNISLSYAPIQINLNETYAKYEDILAIMRQKHSAWHTK